jgi:hypothetical protein
VCDWNEIILINGKDNDRLFFGFICINAEYAEFISGYTELREGYILLAASQEKRNNMILRISIYLINME